MRFRTTLAEECFTVIPYFYSGLEIEDYLERLNNKINAISVLCQKLSCRPWRGWGGGWGCALLWIVTWEMWTSLNGRCKQWRIRFFVSANIYWSTLSKTGAVCLKFVTDCPNGEGYFQPITKRMGCLSHLLGVIKVDLVPLRVLSLKRLQSGNF